MMRPHPAQLRKSLEMAQALAKNGLEFVPIPSMGVQDYSDLVNQLGSRMSALALQSEAEEAGATGQDKPKEPTNREKIEAIAHESVLVHTPLYALRNGMISSYQEALEHMVLSMAKHNKNLLRDLVTAHLNSPVPVSMSMCNTCRKPIKPHAMTGTACDCSTHPTVDAAGGSEKA